MKLPGWPGIEGMIWPDLGEAQGLMIFFFLYGGVGAFFCLESENIREVWRLGHGH